MRGATPASYLSSVVLVSWFILFLWHVNQLCHLYMIPLSTFICLNTCWGGSVKRRQGRWIEKGLYAMLYTICYMENLLVFPIGQRIKEIIKWINSQAIHSVVISFCFVASMLEPGRVLASFDESEIIKVSPYKSFFLSLMPQRNCNLFSGQIGCLALISINCCIRKCGIYPSILNSWSQFLN